MWFSSLKLIARQSRFTYLTLFLIGFAGVFLCVLTDPGEAGLQSFLGMEDSALGTAFIGDMLGTLLELENTENSAFYLYFVLLYFIAYLSNAFPVAGLWLGGSGITEELVMNMADIFITSSQKKEKLVYRHLVAHGILFSVLTAFLCVQIPISYELLGYSIDYDRVLKAYILLWVAGVTFFAIAFFFTMLTLRNDIGRGMAGLVFMTSFLVMIIINLNPNLKDLENFNLLHYLSSNSILLKGDNLTAENFLPLVLAAVLITTGILIFRKRDPLPLQLNRKKQEPITEEMTRNGRLVAIRNKLVIKDLFRRFLKRISPISSEQWVADRIIMLFFLVFTIFAIFSIIVGYPTGEGGFEQMAGIYTNNPIVAAIMREHADIIMEDPLGPIYPQFYGYTWIYFLPLIVIAAGRVVERDNDSKTLDLMHSTPIKPRMLIMTRMVTVIVEVVILAFLAVILLILGEFALGIETKIVEQLLAVIIIPIAYGSILSFLVAVAIAVPAPKYRKRVIYGLGGIIVLLTVLPYLNETIMPLRHLSLLHYLDLVGLIILGYQLDQLSLLLVLAGVFVVSMAFINYYSDKMALLR